MLTQTLSKQTQKNWWIDAALFSSALIAILSGIYFLFLPVGGYQGGRNPYYGIQILFARETWEDLHAWGGVAMIVAAAIHLAIHWSWVVSMARRMVSELRGKSGRMAARGRLNLVLNLVVGLSFLLTAFSGVYFLFVPGGRSVVDPMFLFSRTTWDLIHTWAGSVLIAAASIHLAIHWKWVTKVTSKMLSIFLNTSPARHPAPVDQS